MTEHKHKSLNPLIVGARLRLWRKSKGIRQKAMSPVLKIAQGTYSDLETGRALPSATTLKNMIERTDLNIIWLLMGHGDMLQGSKPTGDSL